MRERSILLCRDAMEVAVHTHKAQMREDVHRSLMPLFFHLHENDRKVAQVGISKPFERASTGAQPAESPRRARSPSTCLQPQSWQQLRRWAGTRPPPALPDPAELSSSAQPQRPKHWSPRGLPCGACRCLRPGLGPATLATPPLCPGNPRSCPLGSGAISHSLLPCRPLRKPSWQLPAS